MASDTTPIWGRPYPAESDSPDVAADIKAFALSMEGTPLYPTTAATSRTGLAGESVAVSPSQTLTLPASPTKGDIIQIIALGTVTGATQVTVATAGGKVINGVGLNAASSLVLGTPNASIKLQYDGTAWRVIAGQQDTGWVALTMDSGVTAVSGNVPSARRQGDWIELRGELENTSGSTMIPYTNSFALVPAFALPPTSNLTFPVNTDTTASTVVVAQIYTDHHIYCGSPVSNNGFLSFTGVRYSAS
jgi:hypothetical protein